MDQQVRIRMHGQALECHGFTLIRRDHRRRMACKASDSRIFWSRSKQLLPSRRARREFRWLRRVEESHENREHLPVRQNVKWIVKALISRISRIGPKNVVRFTHVLMALRRLVRGLRK